MDQQDEVTALRDIIKHDMTMDTRALEKLDEARLLLNTFVADNVDILAKLDEVEGCIKSLPSDKATLSLGLVG